MRNLNRSYLRIALAVGLAAGPLLTWFVANLPNPDLDGLTIMQRWDHADWELWVRLGLGAITGAVVIAVITWTVLWAATGLVRWAGAGLGGGRMNRLMAVLGISAALSQGKEERMKTKTLMMSLFALVLCTPAHAFFLCANKTTQAVRYPTAQHHCTAAEIPLSTAPSVVDSTGRVVGPFNESNNSVLFDIGGIYVAVIVTHAGLLTNGGLYYTSTDCSGPALVQGGGGVADALDSTASGNDGETLYYGNPLDAEAVTANSQFSFSGPEAGICRSTGGASAGPLAPALSVSVSTLGIFQPPFHLQ